MGVVAAGHQSEQSPSGYRYAQFGQGHLHPRGRSGTGYPHRTQERSASVLAAPSGTCGIRCPMLPARMAPLYRVDCASASATCALSSGSGRLASGCLGGLERLAHPSGERGILAQEVGWGVQIEQDTPERREVGHASLPRGPSGHRTRAITMSALRAPTRTGLARSPSKSPGCGGPALPDWLTRALTHTSPSNACPAIMTSSAPMR